MANESPPISPICCPPLANPDDADAAELMGHIHINRGSARAAKYYYDRAAAIRSTTA